MIVSINQPAYLPWLGYFDRIAASDVHVVLDHVQFEKNSFVNRNKVRTAVGWGWLTVPVETSGKFGQLAISEMRIANDPRWARKHWQTIEQCYARAQYFAVHRATLAKFYTEAGTLFIDFVQAMNAYFLEQFDISVPMVRSSSLDPTQSKSDLVLEICRRVGATTYLSGPLGRNYLDLGSFAAAGIAVVFQDFQHPVYKQAYPGFEPGMAAIDLLFMQGPEARRTLRSTKTAAAEVQTS